MKREDAKLKFRAKQYYTDDGDLVIPRPYAYDIIDEIFDEHEAQIAELMKPKSCDGCKYQIHKVDDVQQNGNWIKYSVFYDCGHDNNCKRNTADRYEPKEMV